MCSICAVLVEGSGNLQSKIYSEMTVKQLNQCSGKRDDLQFKIRYFYPSLGMFYLLFILCLEQFQVGYLV